MELQATLFEDQVSSASTDERPRCRMCARPARWKPHVQQWAMYCGGRNCDNRERICQNVACGESFHINVDGAGTKYCSAECKREGYTAGRKAKPILCAWCGRERIGAQHLGKIWPYICNDCIAPIKHLTDRLKSHHVPHERARQLARHRSCEICERDIVTKVRQQSHGKLTSPLVVDHDHSCCPADNHSCGKCIRGLVCRWCNMAMGMLEDDPARAQAMAEYLERFRRSEA